MIVFRYRWHTGSVAWIIHRLTGVALIFYLFVHLYVLSNLRDPERFEALMGLMKNPLVKVGEVGLLALVAAHAVNGVRLTAIDLGAPTRSHKPMFWAASLAFLGIIAVGAAVFLGGVH
jgi:succinate dehydrogenase / fumarate reductase cytochrome b subunit